MTKHQKTKKGFGNLHHNSNKNEKDNHSHLSDSEKSYATLAQIAILFSVEEGRLITDSELAALCADWDIAYKSCLYFLTYRHFIVFLGGYEFSVDRTWFVEGANLKTAKNAITFQRLPLVTR